MTKPAEEEIPENRRLTRTRQKVKENESKKEEGSNEPVEENRRLTRTTRKNQEEHLTTEPKPAVKGEISENRRLTRTRQKAKEIESKTEESSEPIEENRRLTRTTRKNNEDSTEPPKEENRRLTRTTRKNKEASSEDTSTNLDPKRTSENMVEESKVCIFRNLKFIITELFSTLKFWMTKVDLWSFFKRETRKKICNSNFSSQIFSVEHT